MSHPDEGTIHAWLDGELPPAEAAALEAHVAACASCAAAVAEARGLVAASTRILGALDEVEANVVPATRDPKVVPFPAVKPSRARRPFYRHPQFGAAAAVLVLAVGTWTVLQRAPQAAMPDAMVVPTAAPAAEIMDSAALGSASAKAQDGFTAPTVAAPVDQSASRASTGRSEPRLSGKVGTALEQKKERSEADAGARRDYAGNAAVARQPLADVAAARVDTLRESPPATTDLASLARARGDTGRPPAAAPAPPRQRMAIADSVVSNEARRLTGEIRAQRASPALEQVVTTGAAAASVRQGAVAVLCYTVERSPFAVQLNVPERIALHPDAGPVVGGQAWRVVRVPATGDATRWSWLMLESGAVQLARIEGTPPAVAERVALSPTGGATSLRATLVSCAVR